MNPYKSFPTKNFWAPAVGSKSALDITDLWVPKFPVVPIDRVVTFGSCFAQHFGKALKARGYSWTNMEPPPQGLEPPDVEKFNYEVFSARTGNIYTARTLLQWCRWSVGGENAESEVWEQDGRYYDPFRPAIEPNGFESAEEVAESRALTLEAFKNAICKSNVFVFTMGLTESWRSLESGIEYAVCPGTVAGRFDAERHHFLNVDYPAVMADLRAALDLMFAANPALRVILTVSPVPLTATASDQHVLVATTYSKSVLRAVAGDVAAREARVDYFPSYEIITAPPYGGRFFAENKRSVLPEGVEHVMAQFFRGQNAQFGEAVVREAPQIERPGRARMRRRMADGLVCEEALLGAFGPKV